MSVDRLRDPAEQLSPTPAQVLRARERFLDSLRLERGEYGRFMRIRCHPEILSALRQLVSLREGVANADERLARLIIDTDDRLTSRLDAIARTAPDHDFASIRDAIAQRGHLRVRAAALAAAAIACWGRPDLEPSPHQFWRHAMATGVLATLEALPDPRLRDQAFAAGLLHGLGRLALAHASPDLYREAVASVREEGGPFEAAVRRVTGHAEREIAAAAAEELRLPDWLRDAIVPCGSHPGPSGLARLVGYCCFTADVSGIGPELGARADGPALRSYAVQAQSALGNQGGRRWLEERIDVLFAAALFGVRATMAAA